MSIPPLRKGQRNLTRIERQSLHEWIGDERDYDECCDLLSAFQKRFCSHLTPRLPSRAYFTRIRSQMEKIMEISATQHQPDDFFNNFAQIQSLNDVGIIPAEEIFANLSAGAKAAIHQYVLIGAKICSDWLWDGYSLSGSDMKGMLSCRIQTELLVKV